MNIEQAIQTCVDLEARATTLGFFRPECALRLNFIKHHKFWISFDVRTVADDYDTRISFNQGAEDLDALFSLASTWIEELATPIQQRQDKFLSNLGHLVEEAEYLELDAEPLRNVFSAMTTNLLEHKSHANV